jgi:membrane protease YdiL (CAAX protease family)
LSNLGPSLVDPAEWQEAPEPARLAKTGPDDIPITGEEAVFTMLVVWAVMVLLSALAGHYAPIAGMHLWFPHVLGLAESTLIVLVLVYLFYLRHEEGFIEGLHLDFAPTWWTAGAALVGIVYCGAASFIFRNFSGQSGLQSRNAPELVLLTLVLIVTAFTDELFYRGVVYPVVRRAAGSLVGKFGGIFTAVIVSTVWFGFEHKSQSTWLLVYILLGLGLLTTLVRQFSRSLVPSVAMHLAFAATTCVVLWLKPWGA